MIVYEDFTWVLIPLLILESLSFLKSGKFDILGRIVIDPNFLLGTSSVYFVSYVTLNSFDLTRLATSYLSLYLGF